MTATISAARYPWPPREVLIALGHGDPRRGRVPVFARPDSAVIAYFADIFVLPEWRSRGFGKVLVQAMVEYTDTCGVSSTLLRTQDAPGLYQQFGFEVLPGSLGLMRRHGRGQGRALRAQP